jgi:uncharacterized protein YgiM (DUF1202 family)
MRGVRSYMTTSEQLRREADEAESLSRVVSYAKDKAKLREKAAELRRRAEQLDAELRQRED